MTNEVLLRSAVRPFMRVAADVVLVSAAAEFADLGGGNFQVNPAEPASLRMLLDAVMRPGLALDWIHALPLSVAGPLSAWSVERARWACLDTPAALLQAVAGMPTPPRLRTWWLSHQAQPVDGPVSRPELGLLAGVATVAGQEMVFESHWIDLPDPDPAHFAALPELLADDERQPARLALRQGCWWHHILLPVTSSSPAERPAGTYLVLGGTGGIGTSIARWLLERRECRVILLARRARLPTELARWADRVVLVEVDLTTDPAEETVARLISLVPWIDGVIHAAGIAAYSTIEDRDAQTMRRATAAKLAGALLVEEVLGRYQPKYAVYCSSMASEFGGVGQLDSVAGNGLLDGFANYTSDATDATIRIGIGWDMWSEVGLARSAVRADERHELHLRVGLAVAEGQQLFGHALRLQLPQLLISTTPLSGAERLYAERAVWPSRCVEGGCLHRCGWSRAWINGAGHGSPCGRRPG